MLPELTFIGVLASHDSPHKNESLKQVLDQAVRDHPDVLEDFGFIFTGGTYHRLFEGAPAHGQSSPVEHQLEEATIEWLLERGKVVYLPKTDEGGVTILATLVTCRRVSILWPFFSPLTTHLLFPENLALLRLADQWRVKKLMNRGSVQEWLGREATRDANLNRQSSNLRVELRKGITLEAAKKPGNVRAIQRPLSNGFPDFLADTREKLEREAAQAVVALISHDEMKSRMLDFVVDHENELGLFKKILATGTTGKLVEEAAPSLAKADKVHRYHSGPKGGDVEIATEILFGGCHVVIFFVDPLRPHPHTEDIRVVFGACMIQDEVRMLSNEVQARDWMDRLVRGA